MTCLCGCENSTGILFKQWAAGCHKMQPHAGSEGNHTRVQVREQHRQQLKEHHEAFHEVWGQLLKTGYQNSRFAHQVERYACVYTSHVSNLSFYSPEKSYRLAPVYLAWTLWSVRE